MRTNGAQVDQSVSGGRHARFAELERMSRDRHTRMAKDLAALPGFEITRPLPNVRGLCQQSFWPMAPRNAGDAENVEIVDYH